MAPEAHGARVLPDPDYRPTNMICPTKIGMPYSMKFFQNCTVEAAEAPWTPFRTPLTPGVGVQAQNPAKNLPIIQKYSLAKFQKDWSNSLDFYRGHTHTHTQTRIQLYI